ncbi:hypothetical protein ES703_82771 [subsurface metagenome]
MTLTAGRTSDRVGRKRILLISIILSIIASTGYYLSKSPSTLLFFRILEGASRGMLWPIVEAIAADNTSFAGRAKVMGRFAAAYGAGATIGTLSCGFIMDFVSLTAVFLFYPVLGLAALVLSLLGIADVRKTYHHNVSISIFSNGSPALSEIKKIWPVCYLGFSYAGFLYSIWGLLSRVAETFGVSSRGIGVIFALFWGFRLISFCFCGEATEAIGRKKVLIGGVCSCTLAAGIFLTANTFWLLTIASIAGGVGTGIMYPLCITFIADYASPSFHGFDMGFMEFIMGIGMITQTTLSGIMGEVGGAQRTYLFTFAVTLVALAVSIFLIHDVKRN